jgi:hypothetical protein
VIGALIVAGLVVLLAKVKTLANGNEMCDFRYSMK